MHPGADRLAVDDLAEQVDQALAVGGRHPLGQLAFVIAGDLAAGGQLRPTLAGQEQGPDAPVLRIGTALDEATPFELVDQRDHAARRALDRLADRLLRAALGGVDEIEDPEQRGGQIDLLHPLGETPRRMQPDLRKQESEARRSLVPGDRPTRHQSRSLDDLLSAMNGFVHKPFYPLTNFTPERPPEND